MGRRKFQVLVVDDEPGIRLLCQHALQSDEIQFTQAADGPSALESFLEQAFDLVLLDVHMAGMSGVDVLQHLRRFTSCPNLKVLMLSGDFTAEALALLLSKGADDYLSKPFKAEELRARVNAALRLKEAQDRSDQDARQRVEAEALLHRANEELESRVRERTAELSRANQSLQEEIAVRQRAEEESAERARLAILRAEVATALTQADAPRDSLRRCAEAMVRHLHVALARIWTLNERDDVLELQASAGMYTHLDGVCGRVPVGLYEIGTIASTRKPHLSNAVLGDPMSGYQEWALREGMVAFAGYPLLVDDRLVGVLAAFARHHLSPLVLQDMQSVGDEIALGIERKRAEEALRESREQERLLLESTAEAIYGMNPRGECTFCNPACARLLGYGDGRDLLGKNMHALIHPTRPDGTPIPEEECEINRVFSEGKGTHRDDEVLRRADGSCFAAEYWSHPVRRDGEIVGAVVTFLDISERKLLQDQFRQAQKMEAVGQLAAGIAHEINTPIQYVGDNTQFVREAFADVAEVLRASSRLLEGAKESGLRADLVSDVEQAASRADVDYLLDEVPRAIEQTLDGVKAVARIVRAMKEFSHPGSDEKSAVDLNRAIENTLTVARNEWKYVADVVTHFDPALSLVPCFVGEFNQVILNLVINASHAIADHLGREEGAKGTITLSTQQRGEEVEIRVADTGGGIPEAIRSRVFDPFFTTKPVGKGTGQGLAIAYAVVVKKHGGSIAFETEAGKGTTFVIRLPLRMDMATA